MLQPRRGDVNDRFVLASRWFRRASLDGGCHSSRLTKSHHPYSAEIGPYVGWSWNGGDGRMGRNSRLGHGRAVAALVTLREPFSAAPFRLCSSLFALAREKRRPIVRAGATIVAVRVPSTGKWDCLQKRLPPVRWPIALAPIAEFLAAAPARRRRSPGPISRSFALRSSTVPMLGTVILAGA
jgi:hypothetical protein